MPASSSASWRRWSRRAVAAMMPSTCLARIVCESSSSRSGSLSVLAVSARVAGRHEAVLDPAQDRREERVGQVRDQHADRVRAVRLQPARDRVRPIAELLGGLEDAARRLLVDERARLLVERPGYRGRVHASHARDVSQRHGRARFRVRNRHRRALCTRLQRSFEPLTDTALSTKASTPADESALAPLRRPGFRAAWTALAGSQLVIWMNTVGAVTVIAALSDSPTLIALVQTANSVPAVLLALCDGLDGRHRRPQALRDRVTGLDARLGRRARGADPGRR